MFCHPDVLIASPTTALYYRGLTALSIKAAKRYVGAIENLELGRSGARLKPEKALKMSRVYNAIICSIIENSTDWTLENGYRTVIASLGITLDGIMRNKVGDVAESRVRSLILDWLISHDLLIEPLVERTAILAGEFPRLFQLVGGVEMEFRSEPDVSFRKVGELQATVEIKGGTDPAGALERYGAAKKSFEHAIAECSRCKNFFLACVFTPELQRRIGEDRLVEKTFDIVELLESQELREDFFRELFHHTLRIV